MKVTKVEVIKGDGMAVLAYVHIEFDDAFVVHDIRIIKRKDGSAFVCMPCREKKGVTCPTCLNRTTLKDLYCSKCGRKANNPVLQQGEKTYVDVAHPANQTMRTYLDHEIMKAYRAFKESCTVLVK